MASENDFMNVSDAAALLGVHIQTLRRLARQKKIPAFKVGRDWRFPREALLRWVEEQQLGTGPASVPIADDKTDGSAPGPRLAGRTLARWSPRTGRDGSIRSSRGVQPTWCDRSADPGSGAGFGDPQGPHDCLRWSAKARTRDAHPSPRGQDPSSGPRRREGRIGRGLPFRAAHPGDRGAGRPASQLPRAVKTGQLCRRARHLLCAHRGRRREDLPGAASNGREVSAAAPELPPAERRASTLWAAKRRTDLLDLLMPEMNGPQFLEELRKIHPDLPVVIVTGDPDGELMKAAALYAPVMLLAKPVESRTARTHNTNGDGRQDVQRARLMNCEGSVCRR